MMKKKLSQNGLSLVEIVLSIALIGFVILVINNIPGSIKMISGSQKEAVAKDIAMKEIEALRRRSYSNISDGTTTIADSRMTSLPSSSGTVVVSECPLSICTEPENVKQAVVTVNWLDGGAVKKVTISTLISEGGLR